MKMNNIEVEVINFEDEMQKMSQAAMAGAEAGKLLRNTIINNMTQQYKLFVGRLPGSDKTKRLKKKRIDIISRWYIKIK